MKFEQLIEEIKWEMIRSNIASIEELFKKFRNNVDMVLENEKQKCSK
jgi:hypothetical protein